MWPPWAFDQALAMVRADAGAFAGNGWLPLKRRVKDRRQIFG